MIMGQSLGKSYADKLIVEYERRVIGLLGRASVGNAEPSEIRKLIRGIGEEIDLLAQSALKSIGETEGNTKKRGIANRYLSCLYTLSTLEQVCRQIQRGAEPWCTKSEAIDFLGWRGLDFGAINARALIKKTEFKSALEMSGIKTMFSLKNNEPLPQLYLNSLLVAISEMKELPKDLRLRAEQHSNVSQVYGTSYYSSDKGASTGI